MPSPEKVTKGTVQKAVELPSELVDRFETAREERGVHRTFKGELVEAMERHLAYPPPAPTVAPLGDAPAPKKPAKKGKGTK